MRRPDVLDRECYLAHRLTGLGRRAIVQVDDIHALDRILILRIAVQHAHFDRLVENRLKGKALLWADPELLMQISSTPANVRLWPPAGASHRP